VSHFALFETPIGRCALSWTERGITSVQLPEANDEATRARVLARCPGAREAAPQGANKRAIDAIVAHLGGDTRALGDIALDTGDLPGFHRRVYEALRRVPAGETVSYGELAKRVGSPGGARAVGRAVGRNPFAVVVPCHRVLPSGGGPGGFSAYGGVGTKARILAIEGVTLAASPTRAELQFDARAATRHIASKDRGLARIIERSSPLRLEIDEARTTFEALAKSIVHQQLAGKAAAAIHGRVCALFPRKRLRPEAVLQAPEADLRGAGLSRGKVLALRDLATRSLDGTVPSVAKLHAMSDEAIVERLVQVRGIGRWTVEMLLISRLGRPDVLPVHDYGVRRGFQLAYRKRALPTPKELARYGECWRPFRTVATWYLWRAVELARTPSRGVRA